MRRVFALSLAALALACAGCKDEEAQKRARAAEDKADAVEKRIEERLVSLEERLAAAEGAVREAREARAAASQALAAANEARRTASGAETRARRAAREAVDAALQRARPEGVRPGDVTGTWTYTWINPARRAPRSSEMKILPDGSFSTTGNEKGSWQLAGNLLMLRFGADGLYRNVVLVDPASDEWGGISNSGNAITLKRKPPEPPEPPPPPPPPE